MSLARFFGSKFGPNDNVTIGASVVSWRTSSKSDH